MPSHSILAGLSLVIHRHDHLYTSINKNIILSSQFKGARNRIHGVPVILCTLDMLAHPLIRTFTNANPITTAIIDEASQIPVGSYVTPFNSFSFSIKKVCMIGDDKQCKLPPLSGFPRNSHWLSAPLWCWGRPYHPEHI